MINKWKAAYANFKTYDSMNMVIFSDIISGKIYLSWYLLDVYIFMQVRVAGNTPKCLFCRKTVFLSILSVFSITIK